MAGAFFGLVTQAKNWKIAILSYFEDKMLVVAAVSVTKNRLIKIL